MATDQFIEPFPSDIDRTAFGNWLSGFTDGEATFGLRAQKQSRRAQIAYFAYLRISLRDDDLPILLQIQAFFQCGLIFRNNNSRSKVPNANPVAIYAIQKTSDLAQTIIPHFERCPLRAKKANDFRVWREGVLLMAQVQARKFAPCYGRGGNLPKWTQEERERLGHLITLLRRQRTYMAPALTRTVQGPSVATGRTLFD